MSEPAPEEALLYRLSRAPEGLTAEQSLGELELGDRALADRPYLILNMVSSTDGHARRAGKTAQLGAAADREVFRQLRTQVDAVMVGANTVAVERYGRLVRDPALRELRERRGLAPDPLAVVISGRLDCPADVPLLQDPESRVLIVTGSSESLEGVGAQVEYLRGDSGRMPLGPVMAHLRREYGVHSTLCEGGPHLNAGLLAEGLVDELFLTLSAQLVGGEDSLMIIAGAAGDQPVGLDLVWVWQAGEDLFLRYAIRHASGPPSRA